MELGVYGALVIVDGGKLLKDAVQKFFAYWECNQTFQRNLSAFVLVTALSTFVGSRS
ncbi:hypothetical protein CFELI_00825 [Corynebacterium felinum]|uniref:Flp pilus assembly pilin Flp n=1 Tax=Corynebacterium felinum TaxID=131318 RepID=A0ABU2B765_9CORY|nr:Flp pilus assembly pilin Flp [Corynebacterium felinum]WJY93816.1 hypothetical protein CFELI_00825 [Corynebacterium felinum]